MSQETAPFAAVIERTYQRIDDGRPVRLALTQPAPDPDPRMHWRCRVVISGLDRSTDRFAYGVDSIHALGLAFEMARSYLQPDPESPAFVKWFDHVGLGLPRSLPSSIVD